MMPQSSLMRAVIACQRWAKEVKNARVNKCIVNRTNGPLNEQLHERYDASDFETNRCR